MIGPVITPFGKMAQNEERWRGYLRRMASGDRQGLAQLYDETSSVIYGLALRMVEDPSSAADIALDVYQQVWSSPKNVEDASSVLGALTALTRRRALGQHHNGEKPQTIATPLPAPESILGRERALVIRALALLEPAQREAIELAFFSGMKDVELGQALGVSPQVIRARISAGMRKLNEALKLVSSTEGNA
ncbi:MAG TPA: sigma factor-like helix-turn-helix DNA-binding protein [Terriglobales bacterium]|jgi:RNA polymerase sigma-70 factor (ECF subfamily)|nr:sigma factor-like helix-turn-helix DNA-binding protein [Terriglobales bacterium]